MKHFNWLLASLSTIFLLLIATIFIVVCNVNQQQMIIAPHQNRSKRYSQKQRVAKNPRQRPITYNSFTSISPVIRPIKYYNKRPAPAANMNYPARRYGLDYYYSKGTYGDYYQTSASSYPHNNGDYKKLALIVLVPLALYLALFFLLTFATAFNTFQTYLATHNFTFYNGTFGFAAANGLFGGLFGYGGNRGVIVLPQQQQQQQQSSNNNNNANNAALIYSSGGGSEFN